MDTLPVRGTACCSAWIRQLRIPFFARFQPFFHPSWQTTMGTKQLKLKIPEFLQPVNPVVVGVHQFIHIKATYRIPGMVLRDQQERHAVNGSVHDAHGHATHEHHPLGVDDAHQKHPDAECQQTADQNEPSTRMTTKQFGMDF